MTPYNLAGLSTDSFEHLIQALFLKVVGPGGIVFGSGPDGAREATFEGEMDYPSQTAPWDGYLVVQAKFLEHSFDSTKKNGQWLLDRLKEELAKFKDSKRSLRKPDYYILCSNVRLTSVWQSGTKDQIYAEFKKAGITLKDYRIWDYDQINRFLDDAPEIARSYACWIQPGYVLSQVIDWIGGLQADFEKAISNYLQKQLVRDHYLRLDQSGVSGGIDTRIPVERVFIDLSASLNELADPPEAETPDKELPPGIVKELLSSSAGKCDFETIRRRRRAEQDPCTGRVVLVGGPGQGKTTVSQYICQLHRAAILRDRKQNLDEQVTTVIDAIEAQSSEERITLPGGRRYPIRIELSEFAKAIAPDNANRVDSLLAYIAHSMRSVSGHAIDVGSLRKWLSNYPWLLILDGLDEVPGSANRIEVVKMVNDLLIDVADENGDVFMVVTSRRQGYKNDFPQEQFRHWYLTPLSTTRALHCAERFASVHMGDADRERVMRELAVAAQVEATARLMRSPLQVTIMATLAQSGSIPDDRWRLFSEYYRIIYEREVAKRMWKVLETNREDIHAIHNRVALLLQIECERIGQTDARLSAGRLQLVVETRLAEQSNFEDDLTRLTQEIMKAASERLVFLVGLEADRVGFEIRSLQEFMAARALLHGREQTVIERLQHIAVIPHWRNTFVFAAANCFSEREWLGDTITGICARLNEPANELIAARTLAGSQLAIDLIESGVATRQPKFRAVLNGIALELLTRPPCDAQQRLAAVSSPEALLLARIRAVLQQDGTPANFGAWTALFGLIRRGVHGASTLADLGWPSLRDRQAAILAVATREEPQQWIIDKAIKFLAQRPFGLDSATARQIISRAILRDGGPPDPITRIFVARITPDDDQLRIRCVDAPGFSLALTPQAAAAWQQIDASIIEDKNSRDFVDAVRKFALAPSRDNLEQALLAGAPLLPINEWSLASLPWPVATALFGCTNANDAHLQADAARTGKLGEPSEWDGAESRWSRGFAIDDLTAFGHHNYALGAYLANTGIPFSSAFSASSSGGNFDQVFDALADLLQKVRHKELRSRTAWLVIFLCGQRKTPVAPDILFNILEQEHGWLSVSTKLLPAREDRVKLYEQIFAQDGRWHLQESVPEDDLSDVVEEFSRDTSRTSLLPVLRHLSGNSVELPRHVILGAAPRTNAQKTALAVLTSGQRFLDLGMVASVRDILCGANASDPSAVGEALRSARVSAPVESLSALATSLLDCLPLSEWQARATAFDDVLRRRTSNFHSLAGTNEKWVAGYLPPAGP